MAQTGAWAESSRRLSIKKMNMAGFHYPGHTELLARSGPKPEFGMMIVGGPLKIMFTTTHVAINALSPLLQPRNGITKAIRLAHLRLTKYSASRPRIGVAGIESSRREHGLFGNEEQTSIAPAIRLARAAGIKASDPLPADTLFGKAPAATTMAWWRCITIRVDPLKLVAFGVRG